MSDASYVYFDGKVYLSQSYVGVSGSKDTASNVYTLSGVPDSVTFLVDAKNAGAVKTEASKYNEKSTVPERVQIGLATVKVVDGKATPILRVAVGGYVTQVTHQDVSATQVAVTLALSARVVAVLNDKNVNPIDESVAFFTLSNAGWGGNAAATASKETVPVETALKSFDVDQKIVDANSGVVTEEVKYK
jgi:hypothetical protein